MPGPDDVTRALRLAERGSALLRSDPRAARDLLSEATTLHPGLHEAWFDLALLHKWSRAWDDALACNLRAADLLDEQDGDPTWWNLGIAATALRRWDLARRAWRAYGIDVPDGDGPIEGDYGFAAVRINPTSRPETLWGQRVDPARIRIENVPLPRSGHRWGDIVLHDGEPSGAKQAGGRSWPVFDAIERWQPSPVATLRATVTGASPGGIDALLDAFEHAGHAAEDWTTHIVPVAQQARPDRDGPGGAPSPPGDGPATPGNGEGHALGIAAPLDAARALVAAWERAGHGRCLHLTEA